MKELRLSKRVKWLVALELLLLVIITLVICTQKKYLTDTDEIWTITASNSSFSGSLFSEGKTAVFLREQVWGDSFAETVGNCVYQVKDVLQNRREAQIFSLEEVEQTPWRTGEQMQAWFVIRDNARFNWMSCIYNSLTDFINPYLHKFAMNFFGSLAPAYSDGIWVGILVNMLCMFVTMPFLVRVAKRCGLSDNQSLVVGIVYILSLPGMFMATNIRMYAMLEMFIVLVLDIQLQMLAYMKEDAEIPRKLYVWNVVLYVLGMTTHYTMAFFMVSLYVGILVAMLLDAHRVEAGKDGSHIRIGKGICRYTVNVAVAGILGCVFSPTFVLQLLFNLRGGMVQQNSLVEYLGEYFGGLTELFSPIFVVGLLFLLLFVGLAIYAAFLSRNRIRKNPFFSQRLALYLNAVVFAAMMFIICRNKYASRYLYGLMPALVIAIVMVISIVWSHVGARRGIGIVLTALLLLFGGTNIYGRMVDLRSQSQSHAAKLEIMNDYMEGTLLFWSTDCDLMIAQYFDNVFSPNNGAGGTLVDYLDDERIAGQNALMVMASRENTGDESMLSEETGVFDVGILKEMLAGIGFDAAQELYDDGGVMIWRFEK